MRLKRQVIRLFLRDVGRLLLVRYLCTLPAAGFPLHGDRLSKFIKSLNTGHNKGNKVHFFVIFNPFTPLHVAGNYNFISGFKVVQDIASTLLRLYLPRVRVSVLYFIYNKVPFLKVVSYYLPVINSAYFAGDYYKCHYMSARIYRRAGLKFRFPVLPVRPPDQKLLPAGPSTEYNFYRIWQIYRVPLSTVAGPYRLGSLPLRPKYRHPVNCCP